MNLTEARIVLRPRGLLESLDLTFRFIWTLGRRLYSHVWLTLMLPTCALLCVAALVLDWPAWQVWLLAWILGGLLQGAFTVGASRLLFAQDVTRKATIKAYRGRLARYMGARLLSWMYIIPFLLSRTVFVPEVIYLEGASSKEALSRSARAVAWQSGTAMEARFVLAVAAVAFIFVFEILGQAVVGSLLRLGTPVGDLFSDQAISAYALFGYFASIPFTATARFLFYINLRTVTDGWDVQVRFLALATAAKERIA